MKETKKLYASLLFHGAPIVVDRFQVVPSVNIELVYPRPKLSSGWLATIT